MQVFIEKVVDLRIVLAKPRLSQQLCSTESEVRLHSWPETFLYHLLLTGATQTHPTGTRPLTSCLRQHDVTTAEPTSSSTRSPTRSQTRTLTTPAPASGASLGGELLLGTAVLLD